MGKEKKWKYGKRKIEEPTEYIKQKNVSSKQLERNKK